MKKYLPYALALGAMMSAQPSQATVATILPRPHEVALANCAPFTLNRAVKIEGDNNNFVLHDFFSKNGGIDDNASIVVKVNMVDAIDGAFNQKLEGYPNESYLLTIETDRITINAVTATGVTRAAQTIAQIAEGYDGETAMLESCQITDWPAFKLRGLMHDIGRSYVSVDEIKKELDLLSRFKVNTFHFYLTENQGWRFEVKQYPQLTADASFTRFAGKFYTQEECRDIEQYAWERGIIVIPEIDMPGHSEAFTRAMGHSMQTDEGLEELKKILDEVASVFVHAPYIHIGADEQTITYPNFLKTITDKVHSLGKKVVAWNPIRGLSISKNTGFDMTQMWSTAASKISGLPNIDCRYNYVNHFDVFADLVGIYKSNIYYQSQGSDEVAGTITAVWNDRKTADEKEIIAQNNLYANVLASAERAWIGGGKQYIETGGTMLPDATSDEFAEFANWERRFLFHKAHSLKDEPIPYVKQTNVKWCITDAFPNGGDSNLALPPETEGLKNSYTLNGVTYGTGMATGAGIYLRHTWGGIIPTYFTNANTGNTAYAWTYVYSPTDQTVGAQIEFQNYGRSENDYAPEKGKWDRKGSRVWLNDTEIMPPVWDNTGVSINSEVDLKNENFSARSPIAVQLKQGWNKVFLKLPYVNAPNVRLNKWMFTFVLTDLEGKNAVDGLIYSPNQCLDESAENVAAALANARRERYNSVNDNPGFYSLAAGEAFDEAVAPIEESLSDADVDAATRAAQIQAIADALAALKASPVNTVKPSTDDKLHAYTLRTPDRANRYPTSKGAGNNIVGEQSVTDAAKWKFTDRGDGTFNMINVADGSYLDPASSPFKTVASEPSKGIELKAANQIGRLIVVNGTNQFNQANYSPYNILNWGNGTNISDDGCKYLVEEVEMGVTEVNVSDDKTTYVYTLRTPSRANRYPTSKGAGNALVGEQSVSEASKWKFTRRQDGDLNMVNMADGSFVDPASAAYNSPIKTVAQEPTAGWQLKPSNESSCLIVVSGSVQFNQATYSPFNILNWGSGTNVSDDGCKYLFKEVEVTTSGIEAITAYSNAPTEIYNIMGAKMNSDNLPAGIYIVHHGSTTSKILVK